jgi:effector-binding domain-containing protein
LVAAHVPREKTPGREEFSYPRFEISGGGRYDQFIDPIEIRRFSMKKAIIVVLTVFISASWIGAGQAPAAPPKIVILDVTPFTYVCVPHKGPFTDMQQVIGTLMQAMGSQRLFPPTGPMMGVYYTAPSGSTPAMVWEIGFPVTPQATAQKPLEKKTWNYSTVASVLHVGPYDQTATLIPTVMIWLAANGYAPAGPVAERYLDVDPSKLKPSELRTELWVPCRKIK